MSPRETILFILLALVFVFLIFGRWRYDLVAFAALAVALVTGVVPADQAFSGFGHPATVIVALVLIVSRALSNSGVVEWIGRFVVSTTRSLTMHVALMSGIAASLSAVMNNVAALALLMPVDLQAAAKAGRGPALSLMPLSFASILGGMITLIGTPPNIIIAAYRGDALGQAYSMFDFAPVGLVTAVAGVLFVTLIGWRLIPGDRGKHDAQRELFTLAEYVSELEVAPDSPVVGRRVRDLDDVAEEHDAAIVGLIRNGERAPGMARIVQIEPGDLLVLEAEPHAIDRTAAALGLSYVRKTARSAKGDSREDLAIQEVVVPEGARIDKRSAMQLRLLARHEVTLLGVSRQGTRFRESVRKLTIQAGDVLLLLGPVEQMSEVVQWLGCLPLAHRGHKLVQREKALKAIVIFASAVAVASLGWLDLAISLTAAVAALVAFNVVPLREVYESVEWPVIVLLGSMIPIGSALESTGGTELVAAGIIGAAAGAPPAIVLLLLLVVTMTLSDVMNNTATAVIAAPIAIEIASSLNVNPDPFLMAVAVGSSCAFLTPIGHKNNTLILGPGGYRFGDYWRMGLPLELVVIGASVPAILVFWPL